MNPVFSIITCTYNAERTLERTIQSIAAQDYKSVELIIVDGASTDGTPAIIAKYEKIISKLISEKDRGLYDAMNKGIQEATGDYLIFLNAGDKFHSAATLSDVVKSIDGREDIIYGETALVDDNGSFVGMRHLHAPEKLDWKSFRNGMLVCHQAFWVRRTLATATPYDLEYRYSADVDWCIRIMKQSSVLKNTGMVLIDYLNEGMTTSNHKASLKERFKIMSRHYGLYQNILRHLWFAVRNILR